MRERDMRQDVSEIAGPSPILQRPVPVGSMAAGEDKAGRRAVGEGVGVGVRVCGYVGCGQTFIPNPRNRTHYPQRFCGKKCRNKQWMLENPRTKRL